MEAFIEVVTPETRDQVNEVLSALRRDREKSRVMQPDGRYIRESGGEGSSSQEALYQYFSKIRLSPEDGASRRGGETARPRGRSFWEKLRAGLLGE